MITTRSDVTRLRAIVTLRKAGFTPEQIREQLHISERTWYRLVAEIRDFQGEATKLLSHA